MSDRWLAVFVALSLGGTACTRACPDPELDNPATATWSPMRTIPSVGGGTSTETTVVLHWSASRDPLPDTYYALARPVVPGDAGVLVTSVHLTGPRELSIELADLDVFLRTSSRLELLLELPDQRGPVRCSHAGGPDSFAIPVTLEFNPPAHTVTASFGAAMVHRGACNVGGPARGDTGSAFAALVVAVVALARRRRSWRTPPSRP
jgi:hypothetical protein